MPTSGKVVFWLQSKRLYFIFGSLNTFKFGLGGGWGLLTHLLLSFHSFVLHFAKDPKGTNTPRWTAPDTGGHFASPQRDSMPIILARNAMFSPWRLVTWLLYDWCHLSFWCIEVAFWGSGNGGAYLLLFQIVLWPTSKLNLLHVKSTSTKEESPHIQACGIYIS